jgi:hypothetical protein
MDLNTYEDTYDDSIWEFNYYSQYILILLIPLIIYIVDHVSNINAISFGLPSAIPFLRNDTK